MGPFGVVAVVLAAVARQQVARRVFAVATCWASSKKVGSRRLVYIISRPFGAAAVVDLLRLSSLGAQLGR